MSKARTGLGLGLGHVFPSEDSFTEDNPGHAPQPEPQALSHGPRSLGVRGGFIKSPSSSLPATRYNRDPLTNPLSIPSPLNSPLLDLSLAHVSPAQHLRQLKRRAIAARGWGGEPLDGIAAGSRDMPVPAPGNGSPTLTGSPTMMGSPTFAASSPVMSSSEPAAPVPDMPSRPPEGHMQSFVGPGIALGIVLGLILLGMTTWAGLAYRRRAMRDRPGRVDTESGGVAVSRSRSASSEATSTGEDVCEKGLRPRRNSELSSFTLRPSSLAFPHYQSAATDKRVSFAQDGPRQGPMSADTIMNLHHQLFAPGDRALHLTHHHHALAAERHKRSSVGAGRRRSLSLAASLAEQGTAMASRAPVRVSIASTLEDIEEEAQPSPISPSSSCESASALGRASVVSSSSASSDRSSAYTTASARSSMSDLTTLSTLSALSSAFPETPRGVKGVAGDAELGKLDETPSKLKTKVRARSQTVTTVKHVNLSKTAVARTMSLQPTQEVVSALHTLANEERLKAFELLLRNHHGHGAVAHQEATRPWVNDAETRDSSDEPCSHNPSNELGDDASTSDEVSDDATIRKRGRDGMQEDDRMASFAPFASDADDLPPASYDIAPSPPASPPPARPENGMNKVLFHDDATTPLCHDGPAHSHSRSLSAQSEWGSGSEFESSTPVSGPGTAHHAVPRSSSFPTKLLARRSHSTVSGGPARRSDVLTGGYLRRALRAFRGGEDQVPSLQHHGYGPYGPYGQHGQHGQYGPYGQHGQYGQYGQHGQHGQQWQYGQHGWHTQHGDLHGSAPPGTLYGGQSVGHGLDDDLQRPSHQAHHDGNEGEDDGPDGGDGSESIWADNSAFDAYYLGLLGELDDPDSCGREEMDDTLGQAGQAAGRLPHIRVTAH